MRNDTRIAFNGFTQQVAKLNAVALASEKFTVTPSIQQKLESAIQESSDFLKRINIIGVDEQSGSAIGLGVNGTIAGRTDTSSTPRSPRDVSGLSKDDYTCKKTDFDTAIPYALLDAWAKFPDFQARLSAAVTQRHALDRIMIGFNGTTAAASTDRATNQMLQDVNIGWLQKYRASAPARVLDEGKVTGKVTIGAGGDYATLDGLVYDAIQLLDPWHRKHPELVVLVDRNLLHTKFLANIEGAADNANELAAAQIIAKARLGGLPIVDAPFFIDGGVMITTLSNLSIYYQNEARRRHLKDEPERDRIADYQSSNEAYVIEDFGLGALVENIQPYVAP
ncbi:phage major capsid protein, P2 family [Pseudomonas spirodelae]|uniref:Phage major capsid protein, P2 family n=1 Tax=Pseudomonas spirodelae TaxID=3101751 RepID=A0ABU5P944_9PSED|nr:phage major capsid protein, P2 family [Pseudomonas sp. T5W1]MEA1606164.1 phage major capsid protein, P2 family [Pseudomonas sp. T5W1]